MPTDPLVNDDPFFTSETDAPALDSVAPLTEEEKSPEPFFVEKESPPVHGGYSLDEALDIGVEAPFPEVAKAQGSYSLDEALDMGISEEPVDLAGLVDDAIANLDPDIPFGAFVQYDARGQARTTLDKAKGFGGAAAEVGGGMIKDLLLTANAAIDMALPIEDIPFVGNMFKEKVASQFRLDPDKRVTGEELKASTVEGGAKWFAEMGKMGVGVTTGIAGKVATLTEEASYAQHLRYELLKNRLKEQRELSPQEGVSYSGAFKLSAALDTATPDELAKIERESNDGIIEPVANTMSLVPDLLLPVGTASKMARLGVAAPTKSAGTGFMRKKVAEMGGKGAQAVQRLDQAYLGLAAKATEAVPRRAGAAIREVSERSLPFAGGAGAIIGGGATGGAVGAAIGVGLSTAAPAFQWATEKALQGGFTALNFTGRNFVRKPAGIALQTAAPFAQAAKASLEYGAAGAARRKTFATIASDATQPLWKRRVAGQADFMLGSPTVRVGIAAGGGAAVEGVQEGLQEWLNVASNPESIGGAFGGGAAFGGAAGLATGLAQAPSFANHMRDLDAAYYSEAVKKRGDDPALFDNLPVETRREVAAMQSAAINSTRVRLVNDSQFADVTGQQDTSRTPGVFDTGSGDILINMDVIAEPELLSTISHEIGHSAYKRLPDDRKQDWYNLVESTWSPEEIETFRTKYSEATGLENVTKAAIMDELFAEHFLGYGSTGVTLLESKKELNTIAPGAVRAFRRLTGSVRRGMGVEGAGPREGNPDLYEFTPFKENEDVEKFIHQSLSELGSPRKEIAMAEGKGPMDAENPGSAELLESLNDKYGIPITMENDKKVLPLDVDNDGNISYIDLDQAEDYLMTQEEGMDSDAARLARAIEQMKAGQKSELDHLKQKTPGDAFHRPVPEPPKNKGGRPKGSKDKNKRRRRKQQKAQQDAAKAQRAEQGETTPPDAETPPADTQQAEQGETTPPDAETPSADTQQAQEPATRFAPVDPVNAKREFADAIKTNIDTGNREAVRFQYTKPVKKGEEPVQEVRELFPFILSKDKVTGEVIVGQVQPDSAAVKGIDSAAFRKSLAEKGVPKGFESIDQVRDVSSRAATDPDSVTPEERQAIHDAMLPFLRTFRFDRMDGIEVKSDGKDAESGLDSNDDQRASRTRPIAFSGVRGRQRKTSVDPGSILDAFERARSEAFDSHTYSEAEPGSGEDRAGELEELRRLTAPVTSEVGQRIQDAKLSGIGGFEHHVDIRPDSNTVTKAWRHAFGGGEMPSAYYKRHQVLNRDFGTQTTMEGVTKDGLIVTSQPYFAPADPGNVHPTPEDVDIHMTERGYQRTGPDEFRKGDIIISDLKPENFVQTFEGPQLIDALVEQDIQLEQDLDTFQDDDLFQDDDGLGEDLFDTDTPLSFSAPRDGDTSTTTEAATLGQSQDGGAAASALGRSGGIQAGDAGGLPGQGGGPQSFRVAQGDEPAIQQFYDGLAATNAQARFGSAVEVKDREFYSRPDVSLYQDGGAGVAKTPEGDLVSVYRQPGVEGNVRSLIDAAIADGAQRLDNYDIGGFLPDYYAKHGFKQVARVKFNPEFAPDNWNPDAGQPDISFMVHDPDNRIEASDTFYADYMDAVDAQTAALEQIEAAGLEAADLGEGVTPLQFSAARNRDYLRAVDAGDYTTAEALVLEQAKEAGFNPRPLHHGTTHEFVSFNVDATNPDSNWGKGNYFTTELEDAQVNYGAEGADLTNRIEHRAEQLQDDPDFEDFGPDELMEEARSQLAGSEERVIPVVLKLEKPAVIGEVNGVEARLEPVELLDPDAVADFYDEAEATIREQEEVEDGVALSQEQEEMVAGEQERLADENGYFNEDVPLLDAINEVRREYDGVEDTFDLEALAFEEPTLAQVEDAAREAFAEAQDPFTGDFLGGEAVAKLFKELGYDSIVDARVSEKFNFEQGVYSNTKHVIKFADTGIKRRDVTRDDQGNVIPLDQRFSDSTDIRFSAVRTPREQADSLTYGEGIPKTQQKLIYKDTNDKLNTRRPRANQSAASDVFPSIVVPGRSIVGKAVNNVGAADKVRAANDTAKTVLAQDPQLVTSDKGFRDYMGKVGVKGEILVAPPLLNQLLNRPEQIADWVNGGLHGRRTVDTRQSAMDGLDSTVRMRELIGEGVAPDLRVTAAVHLWGLLSRQLAPVQQEGLWLRLMAHKPVLEAIDQSIAGDFSMSKEEWKQIVQDARIPAAGVTQIGNSATSNANSMHASLERLNGNWQEMADVFSNTDAGKMRSDFWDITGKHGKLGIKNKVLSFNGLTLGIPSWVGDRWQFVSGYLGNLLQQREVAGPSDLFDYDQFNVPSDPTGVYAVYGTVENGDTGYSNALYEAFNSTIDNAIAANPELYGELLGPHTNASGLHWRLWNAIKNEPVGHSSLDIVFEMQRRKDELTSTEDWADLVNSSDTYTEGRIGGRPTRLRLKDGVISEERD